MDGWITIGTKVDTREFDKQIADLENKMQKEEANKINYEVEINVKEGQIQKAKEIFEKLPEDMDKTQAKVMQLAKQLDELQPETTEYDAVNEKLQQAYMQLQIQSQMYKKFPSEIEKQESEVDKLKRKQQEASMTMQEYKQKIDKLKMDKHRKDIENAKKSAEGLGKTFQKSVANVGKLAVGIIGIRSAIGFLKSASSDLASYDEQYATNIDYIKFALTSVIAPVLRNIVNLAGQLLSYVNAIANAWFGLNLFGNASVKDFQQMKKGAGGVAGAVKEIKKEIAGFDEINVLSDDKASGGGGGGAGAVAPSFDLSGLDTELPDWLQWMIDNGDFVVKILEAIGAGFVAIKTGLDLVQGAGLFLVIDGFRELVKDIEEFAQNPSVAKFGEIMQDIGEILVGLALIVGLTSPFGIFLAIVGQILLIVGNLFSWFEKLYNFLTNPSWDTFLDFWRSSIKNMGIVGVVLEWLIDFIVNQVFGGWDKLADFLDEISGWVYDNVIKPIVDFFQPMIDFIKDIITKLWDKIQDILSPVINFFKGIFDTIWKNLQVVIENVKQIITFIWNKIQDILKPVIAFFKNIIDTIWNNLKVVIDNAVQIFNFVKDKIHEFFSPIAEFFGNVFTQAVERIKNVFNSIIGFFRNIWDRIMEIFAPIGAKIGEVVGGAFRSVVNAILGAVEGILNTPIRAINKLTSVINAIPGINLGYLSTFNLPRLKTGGIINMPNTGVMVGSAIAGESGREGVLPLTDAETMAELGREIGRWITINANITNTMNGRVISRELKTIQNEQNFAYNT